MSKRGSNLILGLAVFTVMMMAVGSIMIMNGNITGFATSEPEVEQPVGVLAEPDNSGEEYSVASTAVAIYNLANTSQVTAQYNINGAANIVNPPPSCCFVPYNAGQYSNANAFDGNRNIWSATYDNYVNLLYKFNITQNISNINQINFNWRGYDTLNNGVGAAGFRISAWNWGGNTWNSIFYDPSPRSSDYLYTNNLAPTLYINSTTKILYIGIVGSYGGACFLAGTEISLADGSSKNIEDVEIGDVVVSYDESSMSLIKSEVAKTFYHDNVESYLIINGNLRVTPNHPMYVNNKWQDASEIKIGDLLLDKEGNNIVVNNIEIVNENVDVYNLEVLPENSDGTCGSNNNYFAEGILVHNKCPRVFAYNGSDYDFDVLLNVKQEGVENDALFNYSLSNLAEPKIRVDYDPDEINYVDFIKIAVKDTTNISGMQNKTTILNPISCTSDFGCELSQLLTRDYDYMVLDENQTQFFVEFEAFPELEQGYERQFEIMSSGYQIRLRITPFDEYPEAIQEFLREYFILNPPGSQSIYENYVQLAINYTVAESGPNTTYTEYSGNTTDFDNHPTPGNITNATIEVPFVGRIDWSGSVNATNQNFDLNIDIGNGYIFVNTSGLHSSFNTTANLTIHGLNGISTPVIKVDYDNDGSFETCTDCTQLSWNGSTLVFSVNHFTNYTIQELPPMNGSGTLADPYQIINCTNLQQMNESIGANYTLANDIDCSDTVNWNSGLGFEPVGKSLSIKFRGHFDGDYHIITDLFINRSSADYTGLFGYGQNAQIENVGLENVYVIGGGYYASAIAGYLIGTGGFVRRVYSTGYVEGGSLTGGLVGQIASGTINDSYSLANVEDRGTYQGTGGIVGYAGSGTNLNNVYYAEGHVIALNDYAGGLVGGGTANINNSFMTGNVTGPKKNGSIEGPTGSTYTNVYWNNHTGNPDKCVGDGSNPAGCTAIQDNEAYFYDSSNAPLSSWDFTNVWLENANSFPTLRGFPVVNNLPTHSQPILNSSLGTNLTTENLTVYNQSTADADGDNVTNIINWKKDGSSIAVLNMPFEGSSTSLDDYSEYANDGTSVNGAVWNSAGYYDFAGNGEHINISDDNSLDLSRFTLSVWIYKNANTNAAGIITKANTQTTTGYNYVLKEGSSGHIMVDMATTGSGLTNVYSSFAVNTNEWHHLATTYNGSHIRLFIDGVEAKTPTLTSGNLAEGDNDVLIGITKQDAGPNPLYAFNGSMDDIMIFDYAMSIEQIVELYNNRTDLILSQETHAGEVWQACITPNDGIADGITNCSNELTVLNTAPVITVAANVSPVSPNSTVNLNCTYTATDIDEDVLTPTFDWYKNNVAQGIDSQVLTAGNTTPGESWNCSVNVSDGASSDLSISSAITISDALAPTFTNAINTSSDFKINSYFDANITINDFSLYSYRYATNASGSWATTFDVYISGTQYNASNWEYIALSQGHEICWNYSAADSASNRAYSNVYCFTVVNTAPNVSSVSITPSSPLVNEDLTCGYTASDADSDNMTVVFDWYLNGTSQGINSSTLASANTSIGDVWNCSVNVSDASESDIEISSNVTIIAVPSSSGGEGGASCYDECNTEERTCRDGSMYVCGYFDDDVCKEWGLIFCDRGETCEDGVCVELPCVEDWICEEWSSCSNEEQTRNCVDWNKCGHYAYEPKLEKGCSEVVKDGSKVKTIEGEINMDEYGAPSLESPTVVAQKATIGEIISKFVAQRSLFANVVFAITASMIFILVIFMLKAFKERKDSKKPKKKVKKSIKKKK